MAIRYKNPQTGEYEVIKIPVMKGEQGHAGIHVGTDAPPTTDVKLWFDPSDTDNDVDLANRLDTTLTACYDYMGNDRGSIKAAADANVDWLLGEINTVHHDGQHITATDTIEGRSKSASLKGNTLVNLFKYSSSTDGFGGYFDKTTSATKYMTFNNRIVKYHLPANTNMPGGASTPFRISANDERFVVGKEYSLVFRVLTLENARSVVVLGTGYIDSTDYIKVDFIFDGTDVSMIKFGRLPVDSTLDMTIEVEMLYLGEKLPEDMDLNIPYFEGMQSVRMPVLKTTGKNIFDWHSIEFLKNGNQYTSNYDSSSPIRPFKVEEGEKYVVVTKGSVNDGQYSAMYFGGDDLEYLSDPNNQSKAFVVQGAGGATLKDSVERKFLVVARKTCEVTRIMIHGSGLTSIYSIDYIGVFKADNVNNVSYTPYKSNILTVNEDVTLRGIGDVKDELNLLTGEAVERIGEIVLNGNESWWFANSPDNPENTGTWTHSENTWLLGVDFTTISSNAHSVKNTISDKYPVYYNYSFSDSEYFNILSNNNALLFRVRKDRFSDKSIVNFKSWLSQNPITIQYQLTTESIKTVDLSDNHVYSYKDVTHYDCSSEEGSLVPTLSIDVPTNLSALVTKQRQQIRTLEEENKELNQELELAIASSEESDNELLAQSFELDFRLMEVECALDLPMAATFRLGGKAMAMTPYEMAKKLILADNYDRADMEHKLEVYVSKKRMTEAERQELIQLMDEKEGIVEIDPSEPEVEESIIEHEAVTIPLH